MILSMAVLLVPVLIIIAIFARPGAETVQRVDYEPVLATARAESPYAVLAPASLPDDWVPNRVRWAKLGHSWIDGQPAPGNSWQLGYMSPDGTYVGLQQRDGSAVSSFISAVTRSGTAKDVVVVGPTTWTRYISSDGRTRSLVSKTPEVTTVITADTEFAALEAFAATLSS